MTDIYKPIRDWARGIITDAENERIRFGMTGAPLSADEVRAAVREAIDHSRHLPYGQAESAIADRVAEKLTQRS